MTKGGEALIPHRPILISGGRRYSWSPAMPQRHVTRIQTSSLLNRRRRVDWPLILGKPTPGKPGPDLPRPRVVERTVRGQLAALLSAFDDILALEDPDAILRRSV